MSARTEHLARQSDMMKNIWLAKVPCIQPVSTVEEPTTPPRRRCLKQLPSPRLSGPPQRRGRQKSPGHAGARRTVPRPDLIEWPREPSSAIIQELAWTEQSTYSGRCDEPVVKPIQVPFDMASDHEGQDGVDQTKHRSNPERTRMVGRCYGGEARSLG